MVVSWATRNFNDQILSQCQANTDYITFTSSNLQTQVATDTYILNGNGRPTFLHAATTWQQP